MKRLMNWISNSILPPKKKGVVRFMFPAAASIVALMSASVILSTEASYVRLEASKTTVEAGGNFSVQIYAYAHEPVNAIDVTINYDSNKVSVEQIDRGQSVITIWTEDPVITDNKIIFSGGTFRRGFLKEHLIASVDFKAKSTGPSEFSVSDLLLLAGDGTGTEVAVSEVIDSKLNLFIYDENSDPAKIKVEATLNLLTDLDGDGKITLRDISAFMAAWHDKSAFYDFNSDGKMSFRDFSIILANYFF